MRLVTYGCTDQLFKMWCVIPVLRSLQQSPIIFTNDLIIQSEQALFTPLQIHRTKGQTGGGGGLGVFFYNEPTGNHRPLTASRVLLSGKLKKFTTQLHNLFLFSSPQLEWWSRKDVFVNWDLRKWPLWEKLPPDKYVLMGNIKLGN